MISCVQHQRNCVCYSVWNIDINAEDDVHNVVIKPFYLGKQRELGLNEILYFVSGGGGEISTEASPPQWRCCVGLGFEVR